MNMMMIFAAALSAQLLKARLQGRKTTIETRLHGRERSTRDDSDLLQ
jgi:hypothetical protein